MNLLAATTPAANQVTSLPTDNTSEPERYDGFERIISPPMAQMNIRHQWKWLPITTEIISRVDALGMKEQQPLIASNFKYSWGEKVNGDEKDNEVAMREHPENMIDTANNMLLSKEEVPNDSSSISDNELQLNNNVGTVNVDEEERPIDLDVDETSH